MGSPPPHMGGLCEHLPCRQHQVQRWPPGWASALPRPVPGAAPRLSLSPEGLHRLCPSLALCVLLYSCLFPFVPHALRRSLLGAGGRGGARAGLLTVSRADSSSSVKIQPAPSRSRPSTWHCSSMSSPTSTVALGIQIFSMGTTGGPACPRWVRAGSGFKTPPQGSAAAPHFLSDPNAANLQFAQLLPMPSVQASFHAGPSPALCPVPKHTAPYATSSTYHSWCWTGGARTPTRNTAAPVHGCRPGPPPPSATASAGHRNSSEDCPIGLWGGGRDTQRVREGAGVGLRRPSKRGAVGQQREGVGMEGWSSHQTPNKSL